jgi:hypothetical protein
MMAAGVHTELCDREEDMDGKVLSRPFKRDLR